MLSGETQHRTLFHSNEDIARKSKLLLSKTFFYWVSTYHIHILCHILPSKGAILRCIARWRHTNSVVRRVRPWPLQSTIKEHRISLRPLYVGTTLKSCVRKYLRKCVLSQFEVELEQGHKPVVGANDVKDYLTECYLVRSTFIHLNGILNFRTIPRLINANSYNKTKRGLLQMKLACC